MKTCRGCGRDLPLVDFYQHQRMADGHLNFCKPCVRQRVRNDYHARPEEMRERDRLRYQGSPQRRAALRAYNKQATLRDPQRAKARKDVGNAIRDGKLKRGACEMCGAEKSQAHHDDYSRPLDVRWLCFRCHRQHHGQYAEQERPF